MKYKYIACSSFGKDSMATILAALKYGEPLDAVLYCEVMYDEKTSGEIPEHRDFIYKKAVPWLERQGIPFFSVKTERTYVDVFYQRIKNSSNSELIGKYTGFPLCGRCHIQSRCKVRTLERYTKMNFGQDVTRYIGISADEVLRLRKLVPGHISLLNKYGIDKEGAMKLVRQAGLLSPVYKFSRRSGCWFCPNASMQELAHLRKYHRKLWNGFLELGSEDVATKKFNCEYTLHELEKKLAQMG